MLYSMQSLTKATAQCKQLTLHPPQPPPSGWVYGLALWASLRSYYYFPLFFPSLTSPPSLSYPLNLLPLSPSLFFLALIAGSSGLGLGGSPTLAATNGLPMSGAIAAAANSLLLFSMASGSSHLDSLTLLS